MRTPLATARFKNPPSKIHIPQVPPLGRCEQLTRTRRVRRRDLRSKFNLHEQCLWKPTGDHPGLPATLATTTLFGLALLSNRTDGSDEPHLTMNLHLTSGLVHLHTTTLTALRPFHLKYWYWGWLRY